MLELGDLDAAAFHPGYVVVYATYGARGSSGNPLGFDLGAFRRGALQGHDRLALPWEGVTLRVGFGGGFQPPARGRRASKGGCRARRRSVAPCGDLS